MIYGNKILVLVSVFLVVLGLGYAYMANRYDASLSAPTIINEVVYNCAAGKVIEAAFSDQAVTILINNQDQFTLPQVVSASGVRYATEDESLMFWTKGDQALLEENGLVVATECVAK